MKTIRETILLVDYDFDCSVTMDEHIEIVMNELENMSIVCDWNIVNRRCSKNWNLHYYVYVKFCEDKPVWYIPIIQLLLGSDYWREWYNLVHRILKSRGKYVKNIFFTRGKKRKCFKCIED